MTAFKVYGAYVVGLETEIEADDAETAWEVARERLNEEAEELGVDVAESEGMIDVDEMVVMDDDDV